VVEGGFFWTWLAPFPIAIGVFALALCAFLAATYLTVEVEDPLVRDDFRRRALGAEAAVGLSAVLGFVLSAWGAPRVHDALVAHWWSWLLLLAVALAATSASAALWARRFKVARIAAAAQTVLVLLGWALAQYPYLVVPDLTIANAAAAPRTQRLLLGVLLAGLPVLVPSLIVLFRVFKRPRHT
jgi:cytochrome d ubiquinol oxidase subunit II